MAEQVEVAELRRWLQEGRPVTVLDVRLDEDRAQWSIPGSIHVNAYEALRQPGDRRNVTVTIIHLSIAFLHAVIIPN